MIGALLRCFLLARHDLLRASDLYIDGSRLAVPAADHLLARRRQDFAGELTLASAGHEDLDATHFVRESIEGIP
jgi:hypothetical protein